MTASSLPAAAAPPSVKSVLGRGRLRGVVGMFGPAFVAAVAYVDPGNFATNFAAGSRYGYTLVWVLVAASLMAMPVQFLSAKIGIVTGRSLPEICRGLGPRPVRVLLWLQAELVAIATDLAEFVGAAIGLHLLFGIAPLAAGGITAGVSFAVLALQARGHRPFERAMWFLLLIVFAGAGLMLLGVGTDLSSAADGLVPSFSGSGSIYLAAGIVGATMMPHVIYLHSSLTSRRLQPVDDKERRSLLRFERWDVVVALGVAGLVNLAMLLIAAKALHGSVGAAGGLEAVHGDLGVMVGGGAALAFAVALLASGISSSSVGTYAGQAVMAGFLRLRIPLMLRRVVTMVPALLVLASGANATTVLTFSQVVLSFGIPFALVPLVLVTRSPAVMGAFVNPRWLTLLMWTVTGSVSVLNLALIAGLFLD